MHDELQNAAELTQQLAATSNPANLLLWDPSDPGAGSGSQENAQGQVIQPWPQLLSHASTYPAPLPHLLNLVVFFTVDATMLNTNDILYAAPVFSVGGNSYKPLAGTSPAQVKGKTNKAGGIDPGYSWTYLDASGSSPFPDLAVYQTGLTVPAPYVAQAPASGATRIDLRSMWVAASQEDGNEDWRSTLEQRAADTFDLAQKVIDAFRGNSGSLYAPATGPTPDALEQLRITVLSLLRDTADFGLRRSPDGYSTFRYVVDRAARANGVPFDFATNVTKLATADASMTLQSWQGSLLQFLMLSSTSTASAWSLALVDVHTWNTLTPQPQPQTLARLLDALDALQTKLADDATLGQWLVSNWAAQLSWTPKVANTIGAYGPDQSTFNLAHSAETDARGQPRRSLFRSGCVEVNHQHRLEEHRDGTGSDEWQYQQGSPGLLSHADWRRSNGRCDAGRRVCKQVAAARPDRSRDDAASATRYDYVSCAGHVQAGHHRGK
jgi:hypothetical protein